MENINQKFLDIVSNWHQYNEKQRASSYLVINFILFKNDPYKLVDLLLSPFKAEENIDLLESICSNLKNIYKTGRFLPDNIEQITELNKKMEEKRFLIWTQRLNYDPEKYSKCPFKGNKEIEKAYVDGWEWLIKDFDPKMYDKCPFKDSQKMKNARINGWIKKIDRSYLYYNDCPIKEDEDFKRVYLNHIKQNFEEDYQYWNYLHPEIRNKKEFIDMQVDCLIRKIMKEPITAYDLCPNEFRKKPEIKDAFLKSFIVLAESVPNMFNRFPDVFRDNEDVKSAYSRGLAKQTGKTNKTSKTNWYSKYANNRNVWITTNVKMIDFPNLKQPDEDSCAITCIQMVLTYYGIDTAHSELIKVFKQRKVNGKADGWYMEDLEKIAKHYGLKSKITTINTENLKELVDNKIPAIIAIQAYGDNKKDLINKNKNGHNVVVVGYDNTNIYFADPSSPIITFLSIKDLEKRWHDEEKDVIEKTALVVYGTPFYEGLRAVNIDDEYEKWNHKNVSAEQMRKLSDVLWKKIEKMFENKEELIKKVKSVLSGKEKEFVGSILNYKIYFVDSNVIKKKYDMDFTEGGHYIVYDFIPKNEVWIDFEKDFNVCRHDLLHEIIEVFVMERFNMSYDKAHELANKIEKEKIS